MIQRIQSVFLVLVVLLGVLFSYLPILEFIGYETTYVMNAYKTVAVTDTTIVISKNMGVGVLQGLIAVVALIIIFLFKNRQLQLKLAKLIILFIAFQIAAIVMYSDTAKIAIGPNANDVLMNIKMGALLPIITLVLTYLAIHFIKKDDDLVRAADRLR